jgi:hypothetical protein
MPPAQFVLAIKPPVAYASGAKLLDGATGALGFRKRERLGHLQIIFGRLHLAPECLEFKAIMAWKLGTDA